MPCILHEKWRHHGGCLMTAIVAKNKPGHGLIPQFGVLTFLTKILQRNLIICTALSAKPAICLRVIGCSLSQYLRVQLLSIVLKVVFTRSHRLQRLTNS